MLEIVLIIVVVVILYRLSTKNHDYWAKKNIKHDKPLPLFGNHLLNVLQMRNKPDIGIYLYNKYKGEKFIGYYKGLNRELYITDVDIMKRIFTADFDVFHSRGTLAKANKDPLMFNLFFVDGDDWRVMRPKLNPAFSPSKIKAMFPLLMQCTDELLSTLQQLSKTQEEIHTSELMARFPLQFVGSAGFGVELNTLNAEHSRFADLAKTVFTRSKLQIFLMVFAELFPVQLFRPKFVDQELEDIIYDMAKRIRKERNYMPSGRNDVMDAILKVENEGQTEAPKGEVQENLDFAAAQLFSILLGGFETTSISISFTLHQLAFNPDIQKKVQQEIDDVMSKYGDKLTYEGINEMTYLEMAWKESLRMFTPFNGIPRECARRYTIPGTDLTLEPGVRIYYPSQAIHMDPKYFKNPHEFRPERFAPGEESKMGFAYSPFGEGPRKCVGLRNAFMMSLSALAAILHQFTVSPGPSTRYYPQHRNSPILAHNLDGGLPLRYIPRTDCN